MSTRANIVITDDRDYLIFYRHSDGYPDGVSPTLDVFVDRVRRGQYRNNVSQSAGHLILLGYLEYKKGKLLNDFMSWKVGAYEPTTCIHGDIEYLYHVDLINKKITTYSSGNFEQIFRKIIKPLSRGVFHENNKH